jgi:uncharacterized phage protein gp47/JayE
MSYGVLPTGFRRKIFAVLKQDTVQKQKQLFGENFNTADDSAIGNLNGIYLDTAAELWEVAEDIYASFDPGSAVGNALSGLGKITGAFKAPATATTVTVHVYSNAGTTVLQGQRIYHSNGTAFEAVEETAIPATTPTPVLYRAVNTGPQSALTGTVYAGAATSGLTFVPAEIISDAGPFDLTGSPVLSISVAGKPVKSVTLIGGATATAAEVAALIQAQFADLEASVEDTTKVKLVINIPSAGARANTIQVVSDGLGDFGTDLHFGYPANQTDGIIGTNLESDASFRLSRQERLQAGSGGTFEAVKDGIAEVIGVTGVSLLENDTASTDANGLPGKSFEAIVIGGDDTEVATAIFKKKPIGIRAFSGASGGSKITETIKDSHGNEHTIEFSRPTSIVITDLDITVTYNDLYGGGDPAAGILNVKEALVNFILSLSPGDNIVWTKLLAAALTVPGVTDVTNLEYDVGDGLISVNTTIGPRELATLDSAVITVTNA